MHRDAPEWQQGGGNSSTAVVAAAARQQCSAWQHGGGVKLGSAATASSLTARWQRQAWQRGCALLRHSDMAAPAATNAVLPPCAAAAAMKTPAATVMAGAQTINNQLKARKRRR